MKAVEKSISRHENGVLYFVARRGGKLIGRSLRTKNLEEARRLVREEGVQGLIAAREPQAVSLPGAVSSSPWAWGVADALHDRGLVLMSSGAREMAATEDSQGAAFLRFLAATGLRPGGACGLRFCKCVEPDHEQLPVPPAI